MQDLQEQIAIFKSDKKRLTEQMDAKRKQIDVIERLIYEKQNEMNQKEGIKSLIEFRTYLQVHEVSFKLPSKFLINMQHAFLAYEIECYKYPLIISGVDPSYSNIHVSSIALPQNRIETYLYNHVKRHLSPRLPIHVQCEEDYNSSVSYYFKTQDSEIVIRSLSNVSIPVYYLESRS
jgi:hypothetical protein